MKAAYEGLQSSCIFTMRLAIILGAPQQMCPSGAGAPELSWNGLDSAQESGSTEPPQQQGNPPTLPQTHGEDELQSTEERPFPLFSPLPLRNYIKHPVKY